jgi:hypothetical protein
LAKSTINSKRLKRNEQGFFQEGMEACSLNNLGAKVGQENYKIITIE